MARQFLLATSARLHLPLRSLSPADEAHLQTYDFPGNVRELQNLIERALVLASHEGGGLKLHLGKNGGLPAVAPVEVASNDTAAVLSEEHFQALERQNVDENRTGAAEQDIVRRRVFQAIAFFQGGEGQL